VWVDDLIKDARAEGKVAFKKHKAVLVKAGKTEFTRMVGTYYSGELTTFDTGLDALDRLAGIVEQENADRAALIAAIKDIGLTLALFAIGRIT